MISRRSVFAGIAASLFAPAVVRAASLMRIKRLYPKPVWLADEAILANGAELEVSAFPDLFKAYGFRFGRPSATSFLVPEDPTQSQALLTKTVNFDDLSHAGVGVPIGGTVRYPIQEVERLVPQIEPCDGEFSLLSPVNIWREPFDIQETVAWNADAIRRADIIEARDKRLLKSYERNCWGDVIYPDCELLGVSNNNSMKPHAAS